MAPRRGYNRADRVGQQIFEVLAGLMLRDVRDPALQDVQLTAVKVSSDLSHAQIYWIPLNEEVDLERAEAALERASGFLRRQVGDELRMRHVPELHFRYDESVERGRRMEAILSSLSEERGGPGEGEDAPGGEGEGDEREGRRGDAEG